MSGGEDKALVDEGAAAEAAVVGQEHEGLPRELVQGSVFAPDHASPRAPASAA